MNSLNLISSSARWKVFVVVSPSSIIYFRFFFIFGNRKKLHRPRSGEYRGWGRRVQFVMILKIGDWYHRSLTRESWKDKKKPVKIYSYDTKENPFWVQSLLVMESVLFSRILMGRQKSTTNFARKAKSLGQEDDTVFRGTGGWWAVVACRYY